MVWNGTCWEASIERLARWLVWVKEHIGNLRRGKTTAEYTTHSLWRRESNRGKIPQVTFGVFTHFGLVCECSGSCRLVRSMSLESYAAIVVLLAIFALKKLNWICWFKQERYSFSHCIHFVSHGNWFCARTGQFEYLANVRPKYKIDNIVVNS